MRALLAALVVTLTAGCAAEPQAVDYGVVESVRLVAVPNDKPGDSIFAGAAIGGLLGEGWGLGGALLGTVGGGVAGSAVHRRYITQEGHEILVRLDDGRAIKVVQPVTGIEPGERVRVLTGPKGSRIEGSP